MPNRNANSTLKDSSVYYHRILCSYLGCPVHGIYGDYLPREIP